MTDLVAVTETRHGRRHTGKTVLVIYHTYSLTINVPHPEAVERDNHVVIFAVISGEEHHARQRMENLYCTDL